MINNDTISRQMAIDVLCKTGCGSGYCGISCDDIKAIEQLPSAQQERKNGEWIYGENGGQDGWFCSECGFFVPWYYEYYGLNNIDFIADFHTCPKCDSKMLKYTGMRSEQDERSVCDDCERADYWECGFCCAKCYEDYGECHNPDCDPRDI